MKMRHFVLAMAVTTSLVSNALAQQQREAPVVVSVPVGNQNEILPVTADLDPSERMDPQAEEFFQTFRENFEQAGYFSKLRMALRDEAIKKAQSHTKHVSLKRFSIESATFFVAIAAVQLESLIVNYADNPRALQDHLETVKDPIGHLAFYNFMVANGYATDYLQKNLKNVDPLARAQAMRRISYLGMSAGSIASSLTADILTPMKECAKIIFSKEKEEKDEQLAVCDSSLKQWTLDAKGQQYVSQIASLLISTEASQIVEMRGRQAVNWASKKELAKHLAAKAGQAFKAVGLEILTTATPGTGTVKTVKFIGTVTQFAGFTYIDHQISPFVFKAVANVWRPVVFDFNAKDFNESVFKVKSRRWTDLWWNERLARDLQNVTKGMTSWRQAQLSQFFTSHTAWGDNLKKIIEQSQGTFNFYKTYIDSLFSTLSVGNEISLGKLPPAAMNRESYFPFRTLPLYGVKLQQALPADYMSEEDLYLQNPSDLEGHQVKTVRAVKEDLKKLLTGKLIENDSEFLKKVIKAFESNDRQVMGEGIAAINDAVLYNKKFIADANLKSQLVEIRKKLGNPYPILSSGMGFSYAFQINSGNKLAMKTFKRSSGPGQHLQMTADYLTLQMLCGSDGEVYKNPWGFSPSFLPPKIVAKNLTVPALCGPTKLDDMYTKKVTASDGKSYTGITDVIYKNLRPEVLGDFRDRFNKGTFDVWWTDNVRSSAKDLYKGFDSEYIAVLQKLSQNWNGYDIKNSLADKKFGAAASGAFNTVADQLNQSDYLDKNVLANLAFELDIYLSVINEMLVEMSGPAEAKVESLNEDSGGFMRRLKGGDFSIAKDKKIQLVQEVENLRNAVRARLVIIQNVNVKSGAVANFPDKSATMKAMGEIDDAQSALAERAKAVFEAPNAASRMSPSHMKVFESAIAGIQSVLGEVSSLNMAFYTTKYRLEDSYEDVLAALKRSQNEKFNQKGAKAFSPTGG